ncbi:Tm-1-like ATP-binding domain-containing protein [Microbacterium enclense]|uniref:Tm-1-like ATP-binding domain-containing protein n=1 Tax=Microbacterium enclense TaxID=993073 RepID=UPI003D714A8C
MTDPRIAVLATLDTKLEEARYVAEQIRRHGGVPIVVNIGTDDVEDELVSVTQQEVRAHAEPDDTSEPKARLMRSAAIGARALLRAKITAGQIDAVIAIGGGQGSWISSTALRDLPVGFPRLLVSTAGRDVGQYTKFADLTNVFSITDVAGLNPLLTRVLSTAAAGIVGMARSTAWREALPDGLTAMTVYGITTPGARLIMKELDAAGIQTVAFHSNGVGGPTMEQQIASGTFRAVLDWSITEVADDVVGGVCAVGPGRLTNAPRLGLPQVIVPGGVDVVNFGAPDTIPAHLRGRLTHAHTPEATLLRTNAEENVEIATLVADRIRHTRAPIRIIVPLGGFSSLSEAGQALSDPEADRAFLTTLKTQLNDHPLITVSSVDAPINSPEFAAHVAGSFLALVHSTTNGDN